MSPPSVPPVPLPPDVAAAAFASQGLVHRAQTFRERVWAGQGGGGRGKRVRVWVRVHRYTLSERQGCPPPPRLLMR